MPTITELFLVNAIKLDENQEILYGEDQAYISRPIRFATVSVPLEATDELVGLAETILGKQNPDMVPVYYEFRTGLNDYTDSKTDTIITCTVQDERGDEDTVNIDLSEIEQNALFKVLDKELTEKTNLSCNEHLSLATKEMKRRGKSK